ncbi:MAG: histidine phosphatase family protein, partial [Patescibacteria group bacterium]|nr:histidine phosphatase family protein [Patescibacteria group bacterium]
MLSSSIILTALDPFFIPLFLGAFAIPVMLSMRPRRFYFVRHGETILNAKHVHQDQSGGLSENGVRQAERVGKYLTRFHIKRIIASPYDRARETADIINRYLGVPMA